ncbi:MAG: hypothetical protein HYY76_09315 [Acidobacteria bacterium]|nr:hypothetical protein [Acidobacteriota bacterium]
MPDDKRYYLDFTGCGHTLNLQSPQVLQLIMDSLRYWVLEMHVDGFRFDVRFRRSQPVLMRRRFFQGRPVRGDTLLILLNAHHLEVRFALPNIAPHTSWLRILDTIAPHVEERRYAGGATYPLQERTLALFVLTAERRTASPPLAQEARP